jgi:hypothetical protein
MKFEKSIFFNNIQTIILYREVRILLNISDFSNEISYKLCKLLIIKEKSILETDTNKFVSKINSNLTKEVK